MLISARWLFITALLSIPTLVYADDFRSSNWGASQKEVISSEKSKLTEKSSNALYYKSDVSGITVVIMYKFMNNRLIEGGYFNQSEHYNKNKYIGDFKELKDLLTHKYGKPESDLTHWSNDLYKDDQSHWGTAISVGHLAMFTKWKTEKTTILAALNGGKFKVSHGILYTERASEKAVEEKKEKQALDQL